MPELNGQPFKHELRAEIRELKSQLWTSQKEHRATSSRLQYALCKIEELEAKIARMEQKARELVAEATRNIDDEVGQKLVQSRKRALQWDFGAA